MKKIILLLALVGLSIQSAFADYEYTVFWLRNSGLNVNRINLYKYHVQFEVGDVTLGGVLENTGMPLNDDLVALCKEVMSEYGVTAGMLQTCEEVIAKASKVKGYNLFYLGDLYLAANGNTDIGDLYWKWQDSGMSAQDFLLQEFKDYTENVLHKRWDAKQFMLKMMDKIVDQASDKLAEMNAYYKVARTSYRITDRVLMHMDRLTEEDETMQALIVRSAMLSVVYGNINLKIMDKVARGEWVLNVKFSTNPKARTLFEIPVGQTYSLTCKLKRATPLANIGCDDFSGTYEGSFDLTIHHDLDNVDKAFLDGLFFNENLPYRDLWAQELRDKYHKGDTWKPSYLVKEINMKNFKVMLSKPASPEGWNEERKGVGFYMTKKNVTPPMKNQVFDGSVDFCLSKDILGPHMITADGTDYTEKVSQHGLGMDYEQEAYNFFAFDCGVTEQMYPFIVFMNHEWVNKGHADYLDFHKSWDNSFKSEGAPPHMVDDQQIFKNLDNPAYLYVDRPSQESLLEIMNHQLKILQKPIRQ